jgi:hypothetical protein
MDISMDREDKYAYSISLSTNKALVKSFVDVLISTTYQPLKDILLRRILRYEVKDSSNT